MSDAPQPRPIGSFFLISLSVLVTVAILIAVIPTANCDRCALKMKVENAIRQDTSPLRKGPPVFPRTDPYPDCKECGGRGQSSKLNKWLYSWR